ncbi:MAG TPA: CRTAC1 family protein [Candidatus Limnocylindrales bacterium]
MSEAQDVTGGDGRRERASRRTLLAAATVVVVALVVVGGVSAFVVASGAPRTPVAPRFVEETATAGIDHTFDGGLKYFTGGGVAVLDCDGDGRPDVYLAGGEHPAGLYRNETAVSGPLRFTQVPDSGTELSAVTGAYPLDVDADGFDDLAVLRVGQSMLLRGLGDCRFEPANEAWGVSPPPAWTTAFSATWEGAAVRPTMAFGNYVALDAAGEVASGCADSELFRPDATGTGYGPAIPLAPGYCTLSILFSDWDGSGRRDLRVTNDRHYYATGNDQLWRVAPGEPPREYTAADGWVPMQIWGMGIASHDLTGDGLPEVYLTSQADNKLQTLAEGPSRPVYGDIALRRGVTASQPFTGGDVLPSTAWHPEFQDVNNDGLMDLFVSKGNVDEMPDYARRDPSNLFIGQPDGTFLEGAEAAGIVSFDKGRGAALTDFNADGLLDLIEANLGAPVRLWRNVGTGTIDAPVPMGNWLAVRLGQPGGNRDAIGAIIESRVGEAVTRRETSVGGGHIGGQLGWTHVGLGPATEAQVRVTWPDGEVGPWMTIAANQFVDIERGAPVPAPAMPPGS